MPLLEPIPKQVSLNPKIKKSAKKRHELSNILDGEKEPMADLRLDHGNRHFPKLKDETLERIKITKQKLEEMQDRLKENFAQIKR